MVNASDSDVVKPDGGRPAAFLEAIDPCRCSAWSRVSLPPLPRPPPENVAIATADGSLKMTRASRGPGPFASNCTNALPVLMPRPIMPSSVAIE